MKLLFVQSQGFNIFLLFVDFVTMTLMHVAYLTLCDYIEGNFAMGLCIRLIWPVILLRYFISFWNATAVCFEKRYLRVVVNDGIWILSVLIVYILRNTIFNF